MSNGNYPSPAVAYQGVHALIGYGAVLTAAFRLHHWTYGLLAVLAFALVRVTEVAFTHQSCSPMLLAGGVSLTLTVVPLSVSHSGTMDRE